MSMKLAILGLLLEADMHPYEITLKMKERAMTHYTKIQMGSLYYAVDQLAKEEHIEPVEVIRSSNRPDKTIYRITEKGKKLFHQLLLQKFKEPEPIFHPIYLALSFSDHGDQNKIADLLEQRIKQIEHQVNFYYALYEDHIEQVPKGALHLMIGMYEHSKTELQWLKRLYADAQRGKLGEVGVPLDLVE